MKTKRHYYLMISCPSDVEKERKIIKECVDSINSERDDDVWVELNYWVNDTASDAGMSAQESINEQIVKNSDGLIAIFNARLGTPVHSYRCGTEEEIELMLRAGKHVSLLFNTRPQVDLNRTDSIAQISKLVDFKKEQSSKAYYKEFTNDENFSNTVKQEIRLWLREITKCQDERKDNRADNEEKSSRSIIIAEENNENVICNLDVPLETEVDSVVGYDSEAGIWDIIEYITKSSERVSEGFSSFNDRLNQFNIETNEFKTKIEFLQKQPNFQGKIVILSKKYAKQLIDLANYISNYSDTFEKEWGPLYLYMKKLLQSYTIMASDKHIVNGVLTNLRVNFEAFIQTAMCSSEELACVPNIQKDLNKAIKEFNMSCKAFAACLTKSVENCDELISIIL